MLRPWALMGDGESATRGPKVKLPNSMVQYEIFFRNKWHPVVRYDTSHGYAHKDLMYADGRKEKISLLFTDLNICLTYAENDLRANWKFYRERFLKEAGT